MASFLQVRDITARIRDQVILDKVSFSMDVFQDTAIMGETGSGKTSLLKIIAGWVSPAEGEVFFEGQRLLRIPEEKLIQGHRGIAYLSQQSDLPNFLTVAQALEYANVLGADHARRIYEVCRIGHLLARRTDQLSGGEKQRIAIARLLTTHPRLLLLDEPFSNLDAIHKEVLKSVLYDLGRELGITCLMVAHDPQDTLSWAKNLLVMQHGRIIQRGTPDEIYFSPHNNYIAGLGGPFNLIPGDQLAGFLKDRPAAVRPGSLLVRPEDFALNSARGGRAFIVTGTRFFGPYTELEVKSENLMLRVRSQDEFHRPGDLVTLALKRNSLHFIPE